MALLETLFGPIRSDRSACVPVIESEHAAAHRGEAFSIYHTEALSGATPARLHLRTGSRQLHLKEDGMAAEGSDTLIEWYEGRTAALDAVPAAVVPVCSNRIAPGASAARLYTNSAVSSSGGLVVRQKWAFGVEGGGPSPGAGGQAESVWELVLPPHADYVLELSRPGGSGTWRVHLSLRFYEAGASAPAPD